MLRPTYPTHSQALYATGRYHDWMDTGAPNETPVDGQTIGVDTWAVDVEWEEVQ